ncbi:MAG: GIY-YIG nuclease family protein [Planctomycetaceae bacterium]|nr:GIY-YIG nuclease family protein [Planctomycetaceae bacterium]
MFSLSTSPGTYALILRAIHSKEIQVGRLGTLTVEPGFYVYVGSARGPGGLDRRVARHCRKEKTLRWHIDYLRVITQVTGVWCSEGSDKQECLWGESFARMKNATIPVNGFGASDCSCRSHLFRFSRRPAPSEFRQRLTCPNGLCIYHTQTCLSKDH